tara:strand:+ start:577 stop:1677 length:1101 start_codon:yes stop_codon:yes gene_type:complete
MLNEFLMQMRPYFGDAERAAILRYNFEDAFLTEFIETEKFENYLANELGVECTTAVNNGTIALSIAALALGIRPEDEVIVPNFTMIATPNAMKLIGAKPVFADIELDSWCIDRQEIFEKITNKTKAVVLVSANGRYPSYDVDELRIELNTRGIQLIEDAAQSLGSTYADGAAIGTKGNIGTLSFSAPKIISTGQGGLVFSRDADIVRKASKIKDFGREGGGGDIHPTFGINSKFTDLQALVGCVQLGKLEYRKKRRKEQNSLYESCLGNLSIISIPKHNFEHTTPWFSEALVERRDDLAAYLKTKNIGTRSVYPQINKQIVYKDPAHLVNSNFVSDHGLWLPSHMGVTDEMIQMICQEIKSFYGSP